jgi:tRNA threonylcarbamoyladenosine modification (KEOPS) complex Cgi121 subunit
MGGDEVRAHARAFVCGPGLVPEDVKRRLESANRGSVVQAVRGGSAKSAVFLEMLAAQTFLARAGNCMLAKKPEMDFLLRLAGTTQISRAIDEEGAKEGRSFIAVVASSRRVVAPRGIKLAELPRGELTQTELEQVEKAALLNTRRP